MAAELWELRSLLAREQIRDCLGNVARGEDRRNAELIAASYWPEASIDFGIFAGDLHEYLAWVVPGLACDAGDPTRAGPERHSDVGGHRVGRNPRDWPTTGWPPMQVIATPSSADATSIGWSKRGGVMAHRATHHALRLVPGRRRLCRLVAWTHGHAVSGRHITAAVRYGDHSETLFGDRWPAAEPK